MRMALSLMLLRSNALLHDETERILSTPTFEVRESSSREKLASRLEAQTVRSVAVHAHMNGTCVNEEQS